MRANNWGGLITNASPFALPAGAAVEQVNITTEIPGQLTCRGGMRPVAAVGPRTEILDVYPFEYGGKTFLVGMTASGSLIALESPAYGAEPAAPQEPVVAVSPGQVAVTYTSRFESEAGSSEPPVPETPGPVEGAYTSLLDGGPQVVPQQPRYVDAQQQCDGGTLDAFDGGSAATAVFPPSVEVDDLCEAT